MNFQERLPFGWKLELEVMACGIGGTVFGKS